jgi:integrase
VDDYISALQAKGNRTWRRTHNTLEKTLLIRHAEATLADVNRDMLNDLFVGLIDSQPGAARNIQAALSGLFNWAEDKGKLPTGMSAPKLAKAPASKIKAYHPTTSDLRTYIKALGDLQPYGDILRFQLVTGTRIGEALGADWLEIDLTERHWTIPANRMKSKRPHVVMLSAQAVALLERLPTRDGRVFGARCSRTLTKRWAARRDALGLPEAFTTHVVRKALLTWLAEGGAGRDIRDRLSAHSPGKSADAHYQLSELNRPAAEWWQRWADHLDAVEAGGNVVLIDEVRA